MGADIVEERRNTLVCSFDHQSPRISALEIHNWIHDVLRAAEHTVTMIQIDGPRRQVFIKFVEIQYAHDILLTTQGTAEYKHTSGEVSIVRTDMAGRGTKRVCIANLPPEIHEMTLRTPRVSYGEIELCRWRNGQIFTVTQ